MRFISYSTESGPRLGSVQGDLVQPITGMDMLGLIEAGPAGLDQARAAQGELLQLTDLALLSPIPEPRRNIFCVGLNYLEHAKEGAAARGVPFVAPDIPVFFTKATLAMNSPSGDVPLDAKVTAQLDWEVEMAFIIGRGGKNIRPENAMEHVWGYTVANDVSARDVQVAHGGQFFKGKSLDGTYPMGPWIVTADEISDPNALPLRCRVNGVTKQNSNTSEFIFKIPELIDWLSRGMTLLPGDIISTGTPSGVGLGHKLPEYLKVGDVMECEVDGIGTIRNRVVQA